jgi:hypothetical protein
MANRAAKDIQQMDVAWAHHCHLVLGPPLEKVKSNLPSPHMLGEE